MKRPELGHPPRVFTQEILDTTKLDKTDMVVYAAKLRRVGWGKSIQDVLTKMREHSFKTSEEANMFYTNIILECVRAQAADAEAKRIQYED